MVTETLNWACDNFATCGTPAITSQSMPVGWSDNMINGQRVILCQIDTPQLATVLPSVATVQAAVQATVAAAAAQVGK